MSKSLTYVIVIIIIIAAVGGAAAYFLLYGDFSKKSEEPPPPPPPNKNPVAFFKGNTTGIVGELLWFDANGSYDEDGRILKYDWDFGDGEFYSSDNSTIANNTYESANVYTVNLTVVDDDGAKSYYTQDITIRAEDFEAEASDVLLQRIGREELTTNITVENFAISLLIDISFVGATVSLPITEAELEVTITNPNGEIIGNNTTTTRGQQKNMNFYYDSPLVLIPGDFEMKAVCTKGGLYLSYKIEVRY